MRTSMIRRPLASAVIAAAAAFLTTGTQAQPLNFAPADTPAYPAAFQQVAPQETPATETTPDRFRPQIVAYHTGEAAGTIVVDTANTYLYLVLGNGQALRYGIGVGREGFTWSGVKTVARKAEWPDWIPPQDMLARQPYLPRFMAGGPGNPLGARAMYLSGSVYRIHGTNAPSSIGKHMSSGCIRMLNADVIDLYRRVKIGTKVVVLPDSRSRTRVASR